MQVTYYIRLLAEFVQTDACRKDHLHYFLARNYIRPNFLHYCILDNHFLLGNPEMRGIYRTDHEVKSTDFAVD